MMTIIIIGGLISLSLLAALIIVGIKNLAKKNIFFTRLGNEQGKLVMKEENVVEVLSNMKNAYYDENGDLHENANPKNYGSLFKELGTIFFGITPIREIYKFSVKFTEFVEFESEATRKTAQGKREQENDTQRYKLIPKAETVDHFKRFYTHAVQILRIEMADGSKIDMVFLITFKILNIIQVIFKIKPDGIILAQGETGFAGAVQDFLKDKEYQDFRNKFDKSDPNSDFVKNITQKTNEIVKEKFHLEVYSMEVAYYDLSKEEEGGADFQKAQMAKKIAELTGDGKVALAKKMAEAKKIEGEGIKAYLEEIAKIIGVKNISSFANLEQVAKTQLLSYGTGSTPVVPMVNVKPKGKEDQS